MKIKLLLRQYSKVMYNIKVINIFFLPILDGTETMICKYFVLVRHQKHHTVILTNVQKFKIW